MSRAFSLAGFQLTFIGRFWVTPEAVHLKKERSRLAILRRSRQHGGPARDEKFWKAMSKGHESRRKGLENFVAFSWRFFARPLQNLSCFLYVCMGSSLTKEFFRTQGRNFLCDR
jgi:hypothetical protein